MPKPDDAQMMPTALSGTQPAAPADEAKVYQAAVELLSGQSAPAPAPAKAKTTPAKQKTLAQMAEELLAEGAE